MKLKTINQVAEIFQVHRNTVNNWISSGKIKAIHVGRNVRISDEEIQRLIREGEVVKCPK